MVKYKKYILLEGFETNTYLVWDSSSLEAILIDPAAPSQKLVNEIIEMKLKILIIINTHGHGDHIGGNEYFQKEFKCPLGIHHSDNDMLPNPSLNLSSLMYMPIESPFATVNLDNNTSLSIGKHPIKIIHTPGHTRGCICVYTKPFLFSGDTIFYLSVGRTDFPTGNTRDLISSIKEKIFELPDETIILPGHGQSTTVRQEKEENPYL